MIFHKAVWEALKRNNAHSGHQADGRRSSGLTLVKAVKIGILLGLLGQTLLPDILPIADDPYFLHWIGGVLYTIGLLVAVTSRFYLGKNWADIEEAQVLSHQEVVARGIYRYVRHPIYTGDLIMLLGLELSLNSWLVLGVALLAPIVLWKTIREEKMLVTWLPGYDRYCERTKRFIPFVI
jgi:protein-S-isoprenylcysteine O-methyltransferase Ste14